METPNRILIVRLSAIGDVLHGMPVLCALRDALPGAYLAWVAEPRGAELLRGHKALDELVVVPRGWLRSMREVLNLRARLRHLRFDAAVDLQGLSKSAIAAWLSGAPVRIGFESPQGREISPWLNNVRVLATAPHVVDRNLQLLAPLGIEPAGARFDVPESPGAAATAARILQSHHLPDRFVLVNPGAGWPPKVWPAARFAEVVRVLGQRRGLRSLVVWAGEQEHAWADEIVDASNGFAVLAPPTTLVELAAIARRAALCISADTGPLHLAAAVDTPCVGLFGPVSAKRNGPYGAASVSVQKVCLTGSSRARRNAGGESMRAITVDDVLAACQAILDRPALRQSA